MINMMANGHEQEMIDTQIVCVADREGDIYEIYDEASSQSSAAHWLIRAHYDRLIKAEKGTNSTNKMRACVKESGSIGTIKFEIPLKGKKRKRAVQQEIFLKEVTLLPSARKKKLGALPVKTNVIIASEINPPANEKPIEWVLLTSVNVTNLAEATQVIQWYICRWQIEIYFKILKSGCKIEKLQLTNAKRFNACLALYMIIAWRILFITMLGREYPNIDCDSVFDVIEWQTAYIVANHKKPPNKTPTLVEMIMIVAKLGGFLGRKSDGEPGPSVIWQGLHNIGEHIKAREAYEMINGPLCG